MALKDDTLADVSLFDEQQYKAPIEADPASENIEVRFVTDIKDQDYVIDDTIISVPMNFTRAGLSELVNQLTTSEKRVPFDFLIDDVFIRQTLSNELKRRSLSNERTLTIKYCFAAGMPEDINTLYEDEDWIADVKFTKGKDKGYYITASYGGKIKLWPEEVQHSGEDADKDPNYVYKVVEPKLSCDVVVPAVTVDVARTFGPDNTVLFVSGGNDCETALWRADLTAGRVVCCGTAHGHAAAVTDVAGRLDEGKYASASADKSVMIWSFKEIGENEEAKPTKKRQKTESVATEGIIPASIRGNIPSLGALRGHRDVVTSLNWDAEFQLLSGSLDGTAMLWDINELRNVSTLTFGKSVTCIDYSVRSGLVLTGHSDFNVRLSDPRAEGQVIKSTRKSHKGLVSSVAWKPDSDVLFASSSYDKTVKVWDVRSEIPLFTIKGGSAKLFCACWSGMDGDVIATGGAQKVLKRFRIKN